MEYDCPNQTFCRDEHLTRVGFMGPQDVEWFVNSLTERSALTFQEDGVFADIALVDSVFGPTAPCPWLKWGAPDGQEQCWLAGTEPGELIAPAW